MFLTVACNNSSDEGKAAEKQTQQVKTQAEDTVAPEIEIIKPEYDFGTISQGEEIMFYFKIVNKGPGYLKILNVEPSCGCTVASVPKQLIAPGDTAVIVATFSSTGYYGYQYKVITVYTNAKDSVFDLVIKGNVQ